MRSSSCQFIPLPLIVEDAKKAIVVMENVIGNLGSISRSTQGRRHNLKRGERKLRSKYAMSTNTSSPAVFNASLAACNCSKWQQNNEAIRRRIPAYGQRCAPCSTLATSTAF